MISNVWINEDGLYLTISERNTHTGNHLDIDFTSDINQAFAGSLMSRVPTNICQSVKTLKAEVNSVRTVKLIIREDHD